MRVNWQRCFFLSVVLHSTLLALSAFAQEDEIKVGVLLPLSGDASFWGLNSLKGLQLALEDLKKQATPGAKAIRLVVEDERCDPKMAVSSAKKLIEVDRVAAIIGAGCSSSTLAVAPLAERSLIPLVTPISEADTISQAGRFVYRTWASGGLQAEKLADFVLAHLKAKRVAVLSINNDFGTSLANRFSKRFLSSGGAEIVQETYDSKDSDLRAQLLKIKSASPDAMILISYIADGVVAVRQFRELRLGIPLLGTSGLDSEEFWSALGPLAEGIYFSNLADDTTDAFKARFAKAYNVSWPGIGSGASTSYDTLMIIAEALRRAPPGAGSEAILPYLDSLHEYPGVSGPITFDASGDLVRTHSVFQVVGGKRERL